MSEQVNRLDGWANKTTGIGGPFDKSSGFVFSPLFISSDYTTLEYLYEEDHLAGKIVDAVPDTVFRRGWEFSCSEQGISESVVDVCEKLGLEEKFDQAARWEGLYGGGAVFVGAEDGQSVTKPLDDTAIKKVHFLTVFDRWELTPHSFYQNALLPKFGQPEIYRIHPRSTTLAGVQIGMLVHESRLVVFKGRPTTKSRQIENQGWGQSKLIRAFSAVKNYGGALASTLALLADSNQGVYKIKGLLDIIRGGKSEPLRARFEAVDAVRSIVNAIVLDADGEGYERVATPLTEIANIVDRFKLDVASAAEMPVTVLFGQAPAGLNATGESDMRNWYDRIAQEQRRRFKPAMEQVIRLILRSRFGPTLGREPEKWAVKFPSPWQPTKKEDAETKKIQADTDAIYHDLGVLTPEQIARARFSGEETSDNVTLKPEEIAALGEALTPPPAPVLPGEVPDAALPALPQQSTTDDENTPPGEPLGLTAARDLAAKMTELKISRCEHGRVNACTFCGIERSRDVELVNGEPQWVIAWRAIDDTPPPAEAPVPTDGELVP